MREKLKNILLDNWDALLLAALLTGMTVVFNWRNQFPLGSFDLFLCSVGLWLVVIAPTALLPRRFRPYVLLALAVFAAGLLFANQIYFRYYRDFISVTSLLLAGQVYGVRDSILPLATLSDLAYLLPVLLFGLLCLRPKRFESRGRFSGLLTLLVLGGAGLGLFAFRYVPMVTNWNHAGLWDGNHSFVRQAGLFTYHVFDVQRFVSQKLSLPGVEAETLDQLHAYFAQREQRPNVLTGLGHGMNLMVVQLESFESFPVGLEIDGQEVTPHLNRLAADSLFFPNIFYQTARGNTSDAEFMLNNSLLPLRDASVNWLYPDNDYQSLPRLLKQRGYTPVAFHGFNKLFWNRAFMYPRLGFDEFYSESAFELDEIVNIGLSDESFYRQSLEILSRHPEPFFAQLVSLTSHHPFRIPQKYRDLSLPDSIPEELRDYLHAARYADKAIGSLLRALEARGLADRTIVVLYGDHEGISLKHYKEIHQLLGKSVRQDELSKTVLQTVPLFIRVPGSPIKGKFEQVGGQVDILPTLANLMGIEGGGVFIGQDLIETVRRPTPLTGRYPLGSFADAESIFVASPEGGLEDGSYFDRLAEVQLDPASAAEKYKKVLEMYGYSQIIIKHNLLDQLRVHEFVNQDVESAQDQPADTGVGG